jgi:hypothetical protein
MNHTARDHLGLAQNKDERVISVNMVSGSIKIRSKRETPYLNVKKRHRYSSSE